MGAFKGLKEASSIDSAGHKRNPDHYPRMIAEHRLAAPLLLVVPNVTRREPEMLGVRSEQVSSTDQPQFRRSER